MVFLWLLFLSITAIISHFLLKINSVVKYINYFVINILVVLLGYLNTQIHLPKNQKNHYNHTNLIKDSLVIFKAKIKEELKPNDYNYKFYADFIEVNNKTTTGKVLLKISRDSSLTNLPKIGDFVFGVGEWQTFNESKNPQFFDYKIYVFSQNIYNAISTQKSHLCIEDNPDFNLFKSLNNVRNSIRLNLNNQDFTKENIGLIEAFLIGQKDHISEETFRDFKNAGVIHILAVSGLHVGIILFFLTFITSFCRYSHLGRSLQPILIILGLWGFAFLAGLTPSVFRATVMFSFLSLGGLLKRRTSALNSLAMSAVVLIIINPFIIFQVGFQLSYLAVFGIITLQPRLQKLYIPKNIIDRTIWSIITVSIAAQFAIMPISLYYFHQFSALFLVANILILPGLGLILGIGIVCVLLIQFDIIPGFLVKFYDLILTGLRLLINYLASFERLQFNAIIFSEALLWLGLIVVFATCFWYKYAKKTSYTILNFAVLVLCVLIFEAYRNHISQSELIILHNYNSTEIASINGSNLTLFSSNIKDSLELKKSYTVQSLSNYYGIKNTTIKNLASNYHLKNDYYLHVIDSAGVYVKGNSDKSIVLLQNSPKINLERLIENLDPKLIIATPTNYKSYLDRWKLTCKDYSVNFYSIYEQGAFTFKFSELKR